MEILRTNNFKELLFEILSEYSGKSSNIMISGGSLLEVLNNSNYRNLDTSKWSIFYADERCDQNLLNYTASLPFLGYLNAKVYRIRTDLGASGAVLDYSSIIEDVKIRRVNNDITEASTIQMDVCILGIGENGHICSLWPDSKSLDAEDFVINTKVDTNISPERVTITLRFLNSSVKNLYFVLPPKNGKVKTVVEPHSSIKSRINIKYRIILPSDDYY